MYRYVDVCIVLFRVRSLRLLKKKEEIHWQYYLNKYSLLSSVMKVSQLSIYKIRIAFNKSWEEIL